MPHPRQQLPGALLLPGHLLRQRRRRLSAPRPIAALCSDCGLCCDGSLFAHLRLEPDELPALAGRLPVLDDPDRPRVEQPCAALEARLCRIYEERPRACRRFDCLLVHAVRDGELSVEEARASIATARAELAAFGPELREARQAPGLLSPGRRLELTALEARLDRTFRSRSRG